MPGSPVLVAAVIPAYRPGPVLLEIARALSRSALLAVVVVDDGSGAAFRAFFDELAQVPKVKIVRHAVNLGKGAALKSGFNYVLCEYAGAAGVVTLDADGQHDPDDVMHVCRRFAATPDRLVLGARSFGTDIPLRSRFGNQVTRFMMRLVLGQRLSDTQTGLRVIPRALLATLLSLPASGYEFELEMLIAVKHLGLQVVEQPIRTIYEPGNPSSHFRPLRDSMRIYFVLLRFSFVSMLSAVLDNVVFYLIYRATGGLVPSQVGARFVSVLFNYSFTRRAVFLSNEPHRVLLPRYLLLVVANACLSLASIAFLTSTFPIGVLPAKVMTETVLFIANFAIQRDFIFTRHQPIGSQPAPVLQPTGARSGEVPVPRGS
jgi:putative flippase GtrA